MLFKFHLYVQRHQNRTYTVVPLPFYDMTRYGINLDEIKNELKEALEERIKEISPQHLHNLEFDSGLSLQRVSVELRPIDRKTRKKRREQVRLSFSLLVTKDDDDGQLIVTVPKLGHPPLTFYVYKWDELQPTAQTELAAWLDGLSLEQLLDYRHARRETLDTLEVEVNLRKPKKDKDDDGMRLGSRQDRFWALREVGINLTAQVAEGRRRKTYRRDESVEAILRTLAGRRNNSVLVTGSGEVGKTAVLHEVVRRIHQKECDSVLHDREVWLLTPDRMIAGAQYIGTWEERLQDIVNECREKQHILFVEDLPGLIEIGKWSKSDQNVAQALKPHIEAGEVIMLGEASESRLRMGESMAPDFINLFRMVRLEPMTEDETLSVLGYVARDIEREMNLRIDPTAVEAAVELTRRFLPYRSFPGKAVRLLENAASDAVKSYTGFFRATARRAHVIDTFANQTGLPEFIITDSARLNPEEVQQYFEDRILGQDDAVRSIVDLVMMVKAGLNDPQKPLGTFMFIGPTGVGKTQMAKALASYLFGDEERMIRFDMSEHKGGDGITRLIGAYGTDGEMTRRVREQPFCVLLLDEFEKADPYIYDIMLQVFGEGRLTDSNGRTTYFHNAIIIMTSNLGSEQRAMRTTGFVLDKSGDGVNRNLAQHYRSQVENYYRPEFVNRIDKIVIFQMLSRPALRQIASRELGEILLRDGITRRNVLVEIDDSVIDLVLEEGYSPEYGARPLKREIERLVVSPMARALALRNPEDHTLLRIAVDEGELTLKAVPIDEADRRTSVTLTSAMNGDSARKVKLDGPGLVEAFASLRRQLVDWDEASQVKNMREKKASLLEATTQPDFWDDGDKARDTLTRFYFLDRLLRRLRQLLERAEYLEDFAILVNRERDTRYQAELAKDYEAFHRSVSYLNIELLTAHLPHRNQAMMLITNLGTPPGHEKPENAWARRLGAMYLRWAERKGYDREIYLLTPHQKSPGGARFVQLSAGNFRGLMKKYTAYDPTDEIALFFEGANVFGFLKGDRGVHKLLSSETTQEEHVQVRVFAIPDGTDIEGWLADYQQIKTDIAEGRRQPPPAEKHSVIRTYALDRSERYVRDMRTGVRLANVKDIVEKGQLDEFILTYLETEEQRSAWEDRFPPTFPF